MGMVDYINCLPVYTAIEAGIVPIQAQVYKGTPAQLNKRFLEGELDITPISSIEYARHHKDCVILPGLSISAKGPVKSIFLFSKYPVAELNGKKVALTTSSATSVVLQKVLFKHLFKVKVHYSEAEPNLEEMLKDNDAALLIGDDAMVSLQEVKLKNKELHVTDLGEAWYSLTGKPMVFAVWVMHKNFAVENPDKVLEVIENLKAAKKWGMANLDQLVKEAQKRSPSLTEETLLDYFETIRHDFDEEYQSALQTFYDYAYESELLPEQVKIAVWSEVCASTGSFI